MKRLIQRVAALTAALCVAAACVAPVYAETANTEKEENVYVSLAGDGSVADIYIVNMFALDGKTEIRDYGAYSSVHNLTSEADISLDGDSVTVSAEAGTFYYQGNLKDAQLPWNISVAYMLDGKNVAADELAGANGHLVISGSVTKNKLADGDFYEAYMVQATVLLDTVKCRNIQTEGATEANVGADKQLSYMKLPGQDLSFTIETDVTDFSMEGISLNAVPLAIHMFGVGPTLGPQLMAEIGDVRRFHSKKALVAFAGIDAPPYQSGQIDVRSRSISKRGSASLRRTLFLVMGVLLQCAPMDEPVYQFMDKKRSEGKPYRVYMMASANKFLRIYYASVKAYLDSLEHD